MTSPIIPKLRIAVVIAVVVLAQTSIGGDLRVAGVAPDLPLVLAIAAGMVGGSQTGAWIGFWTGLFFDFLAPATPIGLHAFTFCVTGFVVGTFFESILEDRIFTVALVGGVATAASVLVFVGVGDLLGQSQLLASGRSWLLEGILVEAVWSALLAVPTEWLYRWVGPHGGAPVRKAAMSGALHSREQRVQ